MGQELLSLLRYIRRNRPTNRDLRYLMQAFSRLRRDVMQSGAFDGLFYQKPLRQRGQLVAVNGNDVLGRLLGR